MSADKAWVVTQKRGLVCRTPELGRLSADGTFERETEPYERVTILSSSHGPVVFSAWKIETLDGQRWLVANEERWGPTGVSFADENVGWIRTLGPLFLTEDGGSSWTQVLVTEPGELTRLFVADQDTAYLYGGDGKVLRTKDRGRTWQPKDLGIDRDILAFECRDAKPDDCWLGTSRGEVFTTSDKEAYERRLLPRLSRDISVTSISLTGENDAWVTGFSILESPGDYVSYGVLFTTNDKGQTWRSMDVPEHHLVRVAAFGDTIWLTSHSAIYRSTDTGKTWTALMRLPDKSLRTS